MNCTWLPLTSSDDLDRLVNEIPVEYGPKAVVEKLKNGLSAAVKAVLIEPGYVDKDYRSTYYHFYAKKGQAFRPDCVRLHFFDETVTFDPRALRLGGHLPAEIGHHYFGYMVLRPTGIATIGRTVLTPDVRTGTGGYTICAHHKVHLLGYTLRVEGFPSMDQHTDISVCAHVACWSILRHYSEKWPYREHLTYDITTMAHPFDPGGLVPSRGLEVSHAERVFQVAGTFPIFVARTDKNDVAFYRQLLAYLESGFPLFAAMHEKMHAVALVGYDWQKPTNRKPIKKMQYAWDRVRSLTVVDDHYLPYQTIGVAKRASPYSVQSIDAFIVALPEKVFYPADAVDKLARRLSGFQNILEDLPNIDECIVRYFITTGSTLRRFIRERESEFDPDLIDAIMTLPFAQFVWVLEISTVEDWANNQISARAVLDATASLHEPFPFWLFHTRKKAAIFLRREAGAKYLDLAGMETTALSRWDQNTRPVQRK